MVRDLPTGTVTFLFSDIEGSTKLLRSLGPEGYARAVMDHRRALRSAFAAEGGVEVDNQGDAFFFAFPTADGAVRGAAAAQQALASGPIRVRMGVHTGTPHLGEEGYVGEDVNKGARIAAAGHGGQVLLSRETRALVSGEITDLGEHRVKDFGEAVWIFQLGPGRFPPIRTISNTNLPRPASSFVGRRGELSELIGLIRGGARLITLVGPGGSGKTRLAVHAAIELVPAFKNGIFWVDLGPVRDPALVADTIAHTIGATDGLAAHIKDREMLLLLDNFEQVTDAATEMSSVVETCPGLVLLVTSREILRVRGETVHPVPPLGRSEAVELFCSRSGLEPDGTVAELCRRLDDLPLAIELAAARARALSPAQILRRLEQRLSLLTGGARDLPERQRTLRATLEWSHDLLRPEEQRLFARLAVFRGGWTLEAAEAVAEADLDVLQSLAEKSLVGHSDERFSMLETIREYATERLEASGEGDALRRGHAAHFLALAEGQEAITMGGDPREGLDTLERDHDNLRAAIERLSAESDVEGAMVVAGSLYEFWCLRGYATEGWRRLEQLLAADDRPTVGRAKALIGSAHLAPKAGADPGVQRTRAEQALALNQALGRPRQVAEAQLALAGGSVEAGGIAEAIALYETCIEGFRSTGDEHLELTAMRSLAWAHGHLGDRQKYREIVEEVLRRARGHGMRRMHFTALGALAWVATEEGRTADALALLKEAYGIDRETLPRSDTALLLTRLALVHAEAGGLETAATLLGRAEVINEETGDSDPDWVVAFKRRVRSAVAAGLAEYAAAAATARGRAMTIEAAASLGLHGEVRS